MILAADFAAAQADSGDGESCDSTCADSGPRKYAASGSSRNTGTGAKPISNGALGASPEHANVILPGKRWNDRYYIGSPKRDIARVGPGPALPRGLILGNGAGLAGRGAGSALDIFHGARIGAITLGHSSATAAGQAAAPEIPAPTRSLNDPHSHIGPGAGDLTIGPDVERVTVQADWGGKLTGSEGDDLVVMEAVVATGHWDFTSGGNDAIRGPGAIEGRVDFGPGNDTIGNFEAGAPESDNSLALRGRVSLGEGANRVRAASAGEIAGGDGEDSIEISGSAEIVRLGGGGTDNTLTVAGEVTSVASEATGRDSVTIGGGGYSPGGSRGGISLGGGENILALNGSYHGRYTGGDGPDTIILRGGAALGDAALGAGEASAALELGAGDDRIRGSGAVRSSLALGPGDDVIGGRPGAKGIGEDASHGLALEAGVDMGEGNNTALAASAVMITAGSGDDSVYLKPRESFRMEGIHLGGGENHLWILGGLGDAGSREAAIALNGDVEGAVREGGQSSHAITVCGWHNGGCGDRPGGGGHAFNVTLDATGPGPGIWDTIKVINDSSSRQSRLGVRGAVTLAEAVLSDTLVSSANGGAGDVVTLKGPTTANEGTAFELDAGGGEGDRLEFLAGAWPADASGQPMDVRLRLVELEEPRDAERPEFTIATVEHSAGEAPGNLRIEGMVHNAIELGGRVWDLESTEAILDGRARTRHFLEEKPPGTLDFVIGPEYASDNLAARLSFRSVTVAVDWSGSYEAYSGPRLGENGADRIIVQGGALASGSSWSLGGGDNAVWGSGTVQASIAMGGGDDTIGVFEGGEGQSVPASHEGNGLALEGDVELGGGANRVRARSAASIFGGPGPDTVEIKDSISGAVDLQGGRNSLAVGGRWSGTYAGGDGEDRIAIGPGAVAERKMELFGGDDQVAVQGAASGPLLMGDGNDTIAGDFGDAGTARGFAREIGSADLGEGDNTISAEIIRSLAAGSGNDRAYLRPAADHRLEMDLGDGRNSVSVGPGEGEVTLSLLRGAQAGHNTLHLQNSESPESGGASFRAVLDAGPSSLPWNTIRVHSYKSARQGSLTVRGSVELAGPRLESLAVRESGEAGDSIAITGEYMLEAPRLERESGRLDLSTGTVFSLDVSMGGEGPAADILRFRNASPQGPDGTPVIRISAIGDLGAAPPRGSRVELVTVDGASSVEGIRVVTGEGQARLVRAGADMVRGVTAIDYEIGGAAWMIWGSRSNGVSRYHLAHGLGPPTRIGSDFTGDFSGDANGVEITGDWGGGLTGLESADFITVSAGVTASGALWDLRGGSDRIIGSGMITSEIRMGAGDDTIGNPGEPASHADNLLALEGKVSLGAGANALWAKSARDIAGGDGPDTIALQDSKAGGTIDLGGGETPNWLTVTSALAGNVASRASGEREGDSVEIAGGSGGIDLGGGLNTVVVAGSWSGAYTGGGGQDRITVGEGAESSGRLEFGEGADTLASRGSVTGEVAMGGGDDTIAGAIVDGEGAGFARGLRAADLGGGNNTLRAEGIQEVTAGPGSDSVLIRPGEADDYRPSLRLGGGENTVWMAGGREGSPVTLALPEQPGANTLHLCGAGLSDGGCADGEARGFHVILDTSPGHAGWDSVVADAMGGGERSGLSVRGEVTLRDPRIESLTVKPNGTAGDAIVITGQYMIRNPAVEGEGGGPDQGSGTVFGLDVIRDGQALRADALRFKGARPLGDERSPLIRLHSGITAEGLPKGARVELVTVDADSDVEGVRVIAGGGSGARHVASGPESEIEVGVTTARYDIGGDVWSVWGLRDGAGGSTYYLYLGIPGVNGVEVLGTDADVRGHPDGIVISQDWGGDFKGLASADSITVNDGVLAFGSLWDMLGGNDRIVGAGEISARILMSGGDDVIGNPERGETHPDNSLALEGGVSLGEGENTLWARSAVEVTGGGGPDSVRLQELRPGGVIHLGGGKTGNSAAVRRVFEGRVVSEASGGADSGDFVEIGGADPGANPAVEGRLSGDVSLGGGFNSLAVAGSWSGSYAGGPGVDEIALDSAALSGHLDLGEGNNRITGSGRILAPLRLKGGSDAIEEGAPGALELAEVDLGDGDNRIRAASSGGITGGSGDDDIVLSGAGTSVEGDVRLGGGSNTLAVGGAVTGGYFGGPGDDTVKLEGGGVMGQIFLGGGANRVEGSPADDLVRIGGGSVHVDLRGGSNTLEIQGAEVTGITAGDGDDFVRLRAGAAAVAGGGAYNLGGGRNRVAAEAGPSEGAIRIAIGEFSGASMSLVVCGGTMAPGAFECRKGPGGSGFSVELEVPESGGGEVWESVRVVNHQESGRADLVVRGGDLVIGGGSRFGNATVSGDGGANAIRLEGTHELARDSMFLLDIGRKEGEAGNEGDMLDLMGADLSGEDLVFDVRVAPRGVDNERGGRIDLVKAPPGARARPAREFVRIGGRIWSFGEEALRDPSGGPAGGRALYIQREDVDLRREAASGQHVISAANAVASSVAAAASARPGVASVAASRDMPDSATTPFWTHFTRGDQREQVVMGSERPEIDQSYWIMNSGSDIHAHGLGGARVTHSLLLQYGSSESRARGDSSLVETSLLGLGYSVELRRPGGAYGRLTAVSSSISGDYAGGFSVSGASVSAEAGWEIQMGTGSDGFVDSSLALSPSGRLTLSKFGELALPSSASTGMERSTLDLGAALDFQRSWTNSRGLTSVRNLYGGLRLSQDLKGGFEFTPKTSDGRDTIAIAVDTEKSWIALDAGWAWSFTSGSRAFLEFSTASANGQSAGGERESYTLGFDLSW